MRQLELPAPRVWGLRHDAQDAKRGVLSKGHRAQKRSVSSMPSWIWSRVREIGPLYSAQRALLHVFPRRWFEVNMWYLREADLAESHSKRTTGDKVRWATAEDFDLLAAFGDVAKINGAEIRSRLTLGHKVAVFIRDGRVFGWHWFANGWVDQHDWLRVLMDEDECFGIMALVDPACRRQGIARQLVYFAHSDLQRAGYRRLVGFTDALNRPSLRAYNMRETSGRVFYIRFLGLTFCRIGRFMRIGRWEPDRRLEIHTRLIKSGGHG